MKTGLLASTAVVLASLAPPVVAQEVETEISVSRFFGACEAEYGDVTDASQANGECGIVTALINEFDATNAQCSVREEIVEWPGYDQLTARLRIGDAPTISVMHQSILSDYVSRGLIMPLTEGFSEVGIDTADLTEAARAGVTKQGEIYAMPFDTLGWLWHINTNLFEQAGLMNEDGTPMLPSSPEELLAQARQFTEATGKPYFMEATGPGVQDPVRSLMTVLYQQGSEFFADPERITLATDEARNFMELFKTLDDEGLSTTGLDYAAATSGFMEGQGGVFIMGTWLVDTYDQESRRPESALAAGYQAVPFPQLYASDGIWSDGHAWVIPQQELAAEERDCALQFMKFLWDNNFEWSRTGQLPVRQSIINSEEFLALPHREAITRQATVGRALPPEVQRQFFLMDTLGEEIQAGLRGQKSIDEALASAESRVNELLANAQ
jgi:multiple sugar transport system substrate-binding protein